MNDAERLPLTDDVLERMWTGRKNIRLSADEETRLIQQARAAVLLEKQLSAERAARALLEGEVARLREAMRMAEEANKELRAMLAASSDKVIELLSETSGHSGQ